MVTGEFRNQVDRIWEIFWSGGVTNPLSVIEQITYLLFVKGLDELETKNEKESVVLGTEFTPVFPQDKQHLRWSRFKDFSAEKMYQVVSEEVFPFIKTLNNGASTSYAKFMADAIFIIPTPQMLERVVTAISALPLEDRDAKGDLYEYLLSKIAQSGTNGQFRTPRHIIRMMVELMKPTPQDKIVDPAAGTGGFLMASAEHLRENHEEMFYDEKLKEHFNQSMFYGFDFDNTMLRIGAMNMMLHGIENPNIEYRDSLSESNTDTNKYTLVLANPPFKGSLDYDSVSNDLLAITRTERTELLFLSLFLRILEPGGRCASIVPDGVLFGSSRAHKAIRQEIIENHELEAIISMPSGVFKPYATVSTGIMIFTKTGTGGTDRVWFYDMEADGFSLDDKRTPIEENDIPDIIARHNNLANEENRKRTEKSFFVSKGEIVQNDYDLSINRYKEIEYEEAEYEEPALILKKVLVLEKEILKGISDLEGMINA